jgi:CDP-glycerol glycerophosphotransferase
VVPIHQVEKYLAECLQSLARQTFRDLEVIMVDDGSNDASPRIAQHFHEHDSRFRLLRQKQGGLGKARNTGIAAACGEFLAFVDSDDVVPDDAYARMVRMLDRSGSDFATGNVQRLTQLGLTQSQFVAAVFEKTRLRTHVTRFRPLLADRVAWNKLWRRSFWDEHAARFPEGVVHEDIPVVLPAHLAARSVDVLSTPVYQWRLREDGARSITQRRLELGVLRDRLAAIERVRAYFAEHGSRRLCRWYDVSLLADDLRRHLVVLHDAGPEYRAVFADGARRVLDDVSPRMMSGLRALDRLKWHLIARGLDRELLEVLRFERERRVDTPPVRSHGRLYGDYPFRTERRLRIPRSVFRLGRHDPELSLAVRLEDVREESGGLRIAGHGRIGGGTHDLERATMLALGSGRWQALRLRTVATRLPMERLWCGFEATVDPLALIGRHGWRERRWRMFVAARRGRIRRRSGRFDVDAALVGVRELPAPARVQARATISAAGTMSVVVRTRWVRLDRITLDPEGCLEVALTIYARAGDRPVLRLRRRSDARELTFPLDARIPLRDLLSTPPSLEASAPGGGGRELWHLTVHGAGPALPVALLEDGSHGEWRSRGGDVKLIRTRSGDAALAARSSLDGELLGGSQRFPSLVGDADRAPKPDP